jgi:ATP-dependent protease HslVU (ClpYQ) peptidase subunit
MTIIVGALCNDGVIIAADGMVSTGFVGLDNLKIETINEMIVACAGSDSLMTLLMNYLRTEYNRPNDCKNSDDVAASIIEGFRLYWQRLYIQTIWQLEDSIKTELIARYYQEMNENFQAMIVFTFEKEHYIYVVIGFNPPVMLRENGVWYFILGSGVNTGLPSIHLIKKVLNIQEKPYIEKGIQLAYWTVKHAIEVTSGGIGGKITLLKLARTTDDSYAIEQVDTTGTEEHIKAMYNHIHSFKHDMEDPEKAPLFSE